MVGKLRCQLVEAPMICGLALRFCENAGNLNALAVIPLSIQTDRDRGHIR
jgi:hypothetical protein